MNGELRELTNTINECRSAYDMVISYSEVLSGDAWNDFLNYMNTVQIPAMNIFGKWLTQAIEANNRCIEEANKLKESVLDEAKLSWYKQYYEGEIKKQESKNEILRNQSTIDFSNRMLEIYNELLKEIDDYDCHTRTIYENIPPVLTILEKLSASCGDVNFENGVYRYKYTEIDPEVKIMLENICKEKILLDAGISEERFNSYVEKGLLSEEEVLNNIKACNDSGELSMLIDLLEGEYNKVFENDPDSMSDAMTVILANFAIRLREQDNTNEFLKFNNALLGNVRATDGNLEISYRDRYLEKLYVGTAAIQESMKWVVSYMEVGTQEYQQAYKKYLTIWDMTGLWFSEGMYLKDIKSHSLIGSGEPQNMSITELKWDNENRTSKLSFKYDSLSQSGKEVEDSMNVDMCRLSSSLNNVKDIEELNILEEQAANLISNTITDIGSSVGLILLGAALPELVLPVTGAMAMLQGTPSTISGTENYIDSTGLDKVLKNSLKTGVQITQSASTKIMQGVLDYASAYKNFNLAQFEKKMERYGSGSSVQYKVENRDGMQKPIIVGINEPAVIKAMRIWQEKGLQRTFNVTDREIVLAVQEITGDYDLQKKDIDIRDLTACNIVDYEDESDLEVRKIALKLLDGEYNLYNDTYVDSKGKVVHVNYNQYLKAEALIDRKLFHSQDSLEEAFDRLVDSQRVGVK